MTRKIKILNDDWYLDDNKQTQVIKTPTCNQPLSNELLIKGHLWTMTSKEILTIVYSICWFCANDLIEKDLLLLYHFTTIVCLINIIKHDLPYSLKSLKNNNRTTDWLEGIKSPNFGSKKKCKRKKYPLYFLYKW